MTKEKQIKSDFTKKVIDKSQEMAEEKARHKISRKERRKIDRMARHAAKEAMRRMDASLEQIFNAKYNVNLHYTDEVKDDTGNEKD